MLYQVDRRYRGRVLDRTGTSGALGKHILEMSSQGMHAEEFVTSSSHPWCRMAAWTLACGPPGPCEHECKRVPLGVQVPFSEKHQGREAKWIQHGPRRGAVWLPLAKAGQSHWEAGGTGISGRTRRRSVGSAVCPIPSAPSHPLDLRRPLSKSDLQSALGGGGGWQQALSVLKTRLLVGQDHGSCSEIMTVAHHLQPPAQIPDKHLSGSTLPGWTGVPDFCH